MPATDAPTFESLLRLCADAAPEPWRPAVFARTLGVDRDSLDEPLNRLRNAGLIKLTDWEAGVGQGYVLTETGKAALNDRAALARHLSGKSEPAAMAETARRPEVDHYARGEQIRTAVFDYHPAPVTRALIAIQVVVFAAGLYFALRTKDKPMGPNEKPKDSLVEYLAQGRSPLTTDLMVGPLQMTRGEWWTLLTCALVHAGGLHLMLNLLSTGALGPMAEGMFGSVRFLAIWLISAIGASVVVVASGQSAVGSSGAICGLMGAQAAFVAIYHAHMGRLATNQFRNWLIKSAIIIALLSSLPRVSAAAHLGGAIAGALVGALLAVHRFGPASLRPLTILGTVAIPALGIVYLNERGILRLAISTPEIAQREIADFTIRLQPEIQRIEAFADDVEENVMDPLRGRRPEQRALEDVRGAVVVIGKLRADQMQLLEALVHTGKYQTLTVENARHAAEELIKRRAEVSKQYEECLRRGDQWTLEKDENFLQFLLNQTTEAQIVYHRAAGGI